MFSSLSLSFDISSSLALFCFPSFILSVFLIFSLSLLTPFLPLPFCFLTYFSSLSLSVSLSLSIPIFPSFLSLFQFLPVSPSPPCSGITCRLSKYVAQSQWARVDPVSCSVCGWRSSTTIPWDLEELRACGRTPPGSAAAGKAEADTPRNERTKK